MSSRSLITEVTKQMRCGEWNNNAREYPGKHVHELFREQAERTPDAVAVECQEGRLSYMVLNQRANQLAHYLRTLGVGPEVRVGLCVDRSLELAAGFLGILKAGGVYVPLDPEYPAERLSYILEDAEAPVLLTMRAHSGLFASYAGHKQYFEELSPELDKYPNTNPADIVLAENLAYLIYTSGSTGRPKGVSVPHRGITNLAGAVRELFNIEPGEGILQFASMSFDAAIWEFIMALTAGGRLMMAPAEKLKSGSELEAILAGGRVQAATLPPSLLGVMRAEGTDKLRILVAAGEACGAQLGEKWGRGRKFFNAYGPTEGSVCATVALVRPGHKPTIGQPIGNVEIFVLDEEMKPVDAGVPGEIFIGGAGLARGYWNRPELTAERFVPHPFSQQPGSRLYRSGDRARWLPDGDIEFLGRVDDQVKIRGYRIEPAEIEAVLLEDPGIQAAVVAASEDKRGAKRLIAYLVSKPGHIVLGSELRTFAGRRLPQYMIPSTFVLLEELPLTSNGKVDRKALPEPDSVPEKSNQPCQTDFEQALVSACSAVLSLSQVPLSSTFVELGGSSLDATQVASAVRDLVSVDLLLKDLLGSKTLRELAKELEKCRPSFGPERAIIRKRREGPVPASFSQQRVWFIRQMEPANVAYHSIAKIALTGDLNVTTLTKALETIVERHEIYRTTFEDKEGQLFQIVHDPWSVHLDLIDAEEQNARLEEILSQESETPFDLGSLPLIRWRLIRLGHQKYVLTMVEHHTIHDGWSFNVFLKELTQLYRSYVLGSVPQITASPLQFADFAVWQRQWMESGEGQGQLEYWNKTLADVPPLSSLPYDYSRPAIQKYRGSSEEILIDEALEASLAAAARRHEVTVFMLYLAAFQILLFRYGGQTDFCIGTAIANRRWSQTTDLIGMLVNNVALRVRTDGSLTIGDVIHDIKRVTLDAYDHQDVPFDQVVQAVAPTRDLSYNPLIQAMLSFHDSPVDCASMPNLNMVVETGISNGSAKFDLSAVLFPAQNHNLPPGCKARPRMLWEYSRDLFRAETIRLMMKHYFRVLETLLGDPGKRVSAIELLGEQERDQIVVDWNSGTREFPWKCVHTLFEEHAEKNPASLAVRCGDQQLTYSALNSKANQLAHYLGELGVGPESLVGICVGRSPEMIVALLGVLKAGAAYLPLDPSYPPERLQYMLEDARVRVLLTERSLAPAFTEHRGEVVCLDSDRATIARQSKENPAATARLDNLAYVIYTSGSTGKPKGVMVRHGSLTNLVCWHLNAYAVSPADRATQVAATGFDASVWEIWSYLAAGASLWMPDYETRLSPRKLWEWLRRASITLCFLPTPMAESVLSVITKGDHEGSTLRALFTGGDKLNQFPGVDLGFELVNVYGPTENTVITTATVVSKEGEGAPPIGRPIANTQVYVLDQEMEPVTIGVAGELYIGGAGLARGYWERPDLTAEKFVPDPLGQHPGARLYRTGDQVRWMANGNLEFLGRIDQQVKIRGFRIELGEVEAVLGACRAVQSAVVTVREDQPGHKRLVAYVTAKDGAALRTSDLRKYLKEKLPTFMVPSHIVVLGQMPLLPSGKLDRGALPAPGTSGVAIQELMTPRTRAEELLAGIWGEVLRVPHVGLHDNFFEIGGHSLLAMQIISRIQSELGIALHLRDLFENPTVTEMARVIDGRPAGNEAALLPILQPSAHQELLLEQVDRISEATLDTLLSDLLQLPPG